MHHYRLPASLLTLMNKFLLVPLIWSPKNIIDSICHFSEHRLVAEHYLSSVSFSKVFIQFAKAKRFFLRSSVRAYMTVCLQNLQPGRLVIQFIMIFDSKSSVGDASLDCKLLRIIVSRSQVF
ncbi:Hypothetical_protein [Hexamita inflata]|uniref:Hypothetical_protein n=1 Tax=Hexamita inflata TaxID=28002 RepID=A0AA86R4B8_9EUKA|nr:Hypothetical protein HINF_LOCUS54416 [Hexamita inflata]